MRREKLHEIHLLMHKLHGLRGRSFAQAGGELPMPTGQARVMHCLWHHPQIAPHDLAKLLEIRPASLSELLGKLVRSGYVERHRCDEDRRMVRVRLTEAGRTFFAAHRGKHEKFVEMMFSALNDDEIDALQATLKKLADSWEDFLHLEN